MGTEKRRKKMIGGDADFNALPEECIANVLSLTSPADVCRLSLVSPIFRSMSESDEVWERFLPSDYHSIIAGSDGPSPSTVIPLKKKQIYFLLCDNSFLIDGGKKIFSLDKWSGKKWYTIAARELAVIPHERTVIRHHILPPYSLPIMCFLARSRFGEVAEIRYWDWNEIRGKISTSMMSQNTTYTAYLLCNIANTTGFYNSSAKVSVGLVGSENCWRKVYLDLYTGRTDGFLEIELGEYFNEGEEDGELEMIFMHEKRRQWKRELFIEGIEIRPRNCKKLEQGYTSWRQISRNLTQ